MGGKVTDTLEIMEKKKLQFQSYISCLLSGAGGHEMFSNLYSRTFEKI